MGAYIALRAAFVQDNRSRQEPAQPSHVNRVKHALVASGCFGSAIALLAVHFGGYADDVFGNMLKFVALAIWGVGLIIFIFMIFARDGNAEEFCQVICAVAGGLSAYTALCGYASANRTCLVFVGVSVCALAITDLQESGLIHQMKVRFLTSLKHLR